MYTQITFTRLCEWMDQAAYNFLVRINKRPAKKANSIDNRIDHVKSFSGSSNLNQSTHNTIYYSHAK